MLTQKLNNNEWAETLKQQINLPAHLDKYCNGYIDGHKFQGDHGDKHSSEGSKCLGATLGADGPYWKCWNCDTGGDVIAFEEDYHGISFREACLKLSEEYGIKLPNLSKEEWDKLSEERSVKTEHLRTLSATTQEFLNEITLCYHKKALATPAVMSYYKGRGITEETIKELQLGYAPPGNVLYKAFNEKYSTQVMVASGLVGVYENNGNINVVDHFKDRYIYPYWTENPSKLDKHGNRVANVCYLIGGRTETTKKVDGKLAAKYIKLKTNSPTNPGVDPNIVKHVLWNQNGYQTKEPKPLLITEGIVDAILARQELSSYYNVISPVTAKINNKDIEKIGNLIKNGRIEKDIIICNDIELNHTGIKRAYDNMVQIKQAGTVEDGRGPQIKVAILAKPYEVDKVDLADYLKDGLIEQALYFLRYARDEWNFRAYLDDNPYRFFKYDQKKSDSNTFIESSMVSELMFEDGFFVTIDENLFHYKNGVYVYDNKKDTNKVVMNKLREKQSVSIINRTIENLKMLTTVDPDIATHSPEILNVKNGLLDLSPVRENKQPVLREHSPYHVSFAQIPVNYDPNIDDDTVYNFLLELLPEEDVDELMKAIGYALIPKTDYDKAILLYGKGGNGKSTVLDLITAFLGEENCSFKSLDDLEKDKFAVAGLHGKLANINADIGSAYLPSNDIFKKITGGDTISGQHKYGQPFSFKPYCTLLFSANSMPKTSDKSFANERRWLFFKFGEKFKEGAKGTDPTIIYKLITDSALSGLLNRAIDGWFRLQKENGFTPSEQSKQLKKEYLEENNPIEEFCNKYLERVEELGSILPISASGLSKKIKAWYKKEHPKKSIPSTQQITRTIEDKFSITKYKMKGTEVWQNLVYKQDSEKELRQILGSKEDDLVDEIQL